MKAGTQLGPYRVESLIGAGGMGEVYRATDTRLERSVAIKMLPAHLSANSALRERFEREARTISSLSHPNICALFDVGRHEGGDYLVMEYLQGETLSERIARGALPREQVLRIGVEIANALDRAHKQGIVHRDLKPGNIMLTKGGVKLLDFGLAKIALSAKPDQDAPTSLATEQKPLTEQGQILGTFQYMAPEQLEGREADPRTDIFALGVVLYEMTTGRRPFEAKSKASLIAAILDRDPPPMSELQPMTPPALERLVRACMAKDPDERMQTARDVALQLRWISEASATTEPVSVQKRRRPLSWIALLLLAGLASAMSFLYLRERQREAPLFDLAFHPRRNEVFGRPVVSHDGSTIAFVSYGDETNLMVRRLDDPTPRKVARLSDRFRVPFFSPDDQWIGYFDSGKLQKVPIRGAQPETICNSVSLYGASWSPGGVILFTPNYGSGGLFRVAAAGGAPVAVTKLNQGRNERAHLWPQFMPDGEHFLYVVYRAQGSRNEIVVGSLERGMIKRILEADALVGYVQPHLLFSRDGAIYAQRLDAKSFDLTGEARRVIENVPYTEGDGYAEASVSENGTIVFAPFEPQAIQIARFDRAGNLLQEMWTDEDTRHMAFAANMRDALVLKFNPEKGATDLYSLDLARRISTRLTSDRSAVSSAVIARDGQTAVYSSDRKGMFDVYVKATDGSTDDRLLWGDDFDKTVSSISPDGKLVYVNRFTDATKTDIWVVPLDGGKPALLLGTSETEAQAQVSPDGKWIVYVAGSKVERQVYARPYPRGRSIRVSVDGGDDPSWAPSGREILFTRNGREVFVAPFTSRGDQAEVGTPRHLFDINPVEMSTPQFAWNGDLIIERFVPGTVTKTGIEVTTAWRAKLK